VSLNQFINVALGMAVGRANTSPATYPASKHNRKWLRDKKKKAIATNAIKYIKSSLTDN
jgi:hypothetical protein